MNLLRTLAVTTASGAMLLGPAVGAHAATGEATKAAALPTTCRITASAPYLQASLIKGDGALTCNSSVAGLQLKVTLQQRIGTRWVNVGVPAQGTRYNVVKVWGTAYTGFAHGVFRTKSTGKVLFYGESVWRAVNAVSGPRSA